MIRIQSCIDPLTQLADGLAGWVAIVRVPASHQPAVRQLGDQSDWEQVGRAGGGATPLFASTLGIDKGTGLIPSAGWQPLVVSYSV